MSLFSFLNKKDQDQSLVSVSLKPEGISLARVSRVKNQSPVLEALAFVPVEQDQNPQQLLKKMIDENELEGARTSSLLDASLYSLILTDAAEVPDDELREAMRWRVKDMIDFDINLAVIDFFDIPGHKGNQGKRMLYVVVARVEDINSKVDLIKSSGLELDIIDIPELALRNLTSFMPEDVSGVATLSVNGDSGLIILTRQSTLLLSRRFTMPAMPTGFDGGLSLDNRSLMDNLVIEVQRSIDYYDSHFNLPPITQMLILNSEQNIEGLGDYLQNQLGLTSRDVSVTDVLDVAEGVDTSIPFNLQLIGAALRSEAMP